MPDPETTSSLDELEQMMAEAETQAQAHISKPVESQVNPRSTCDHEGSHVPSRGWCRGCKNSICQFCRSVIDANYCSDCMTKVDVKVEETALVDDEGVTHHGRVLTPSEGFKQLRWIPEGMTTAKALSEMNVQELEDFVEMYKQTVRNAERALDFARIKLGSGQLELDERKSAERRKLRADKTKYPVRTVTLDAKTGKQKTKTASTTQTMGMLQMLQAMQALKAKVAARTAQTAEKPKPEGEPR